MRDDEIKREIDDMITDDIVGNMRISDLAKIQRNRNFMGYFFAMILFVSFMLMPFGLSFWIMGYLFGLQMFLITLVFLIWSMFGVVIFGD